jgi:hypothetical protein
MYFTNLSMQQNMSGMQREATIVTDYQGGAYKVSID